MTAYPQTLVLADRSLRTRLAESPFESRVRAELAQGGVPRPVLQHLVLDRHGRVVARVDQAWPAYRRGLLTDRRRA